MSGRKRALSASPWPNLPHEIISKIETRLDCAVDVFHLRSVCKNWHSSRNPNNISILSPLLPLNMPNLDLPFTNRRPCAPLSLVAHAVFLVKPLQPSSDPCGWLLFVEETVPGKLRILYPLSNFDVRHRPSDFPKYLDLSKFRVSQVAQSYGFKYESDGADVPSVHRVVLCSGITAMVLYVGGTLIRLRLKSGNWSYVRHSITCLFKDVISCGRDHVQAVDYLGNVHTIDHRVAKVIKSLKPILVVPGICGPDNIKLIRSNGELLAATCYHGSHVKKFEFEIYQLDEVQCEWVDAVNRDYCRKIGIYFCKKEDKSFWEQNHCSITTINVLWPPPTWFWPDTFSSTRDDEELDIHNSRKVQMPSFTANVSTGTGTTNKEVLGAKSKAVGNSHAPAIQLSKEKDSKASFQGIEVQSEHLPILQEIWKKYDDVFEGSILQSCGLKATALECLAKILIILQTPREGFTTDQFAYVESTFADLQAMRLKVDLLVPSVEKILGLHKQLQADVAALEEAKAKAEKTEGKLLAAMAESKLKP